MNKQELIDSIKELKARIDNYEIDPSDYEEEYNDMLNETHGDFMGHTAAYTLSQVDLVMYDCGLADYVDSISLDDVPEYAEMVEELEELENELYDLEMEEEEESEEE